MSGFLGGIGWFIVTLGVLVTFHEFGHYWVARRCGVQVLRFSIGFGRVLWSRVARDGTRYQIALIPLGGYVQFLDEREHEVAPIDRDRAFNRQPVLKRIAIVIAGPLANLVLCVGLLWATYLMGWPDLAPVIGPTSGLAAEAGLHEGERIVQVGDQMTPTWTQAMTPLVLSAIERHPVTLTLTDSQGHSVRRTLPLDRLPVDFDQRDPLKAMGLTSLASQDRPIIGTLAEAGAAQGKLQPGDEILRIGDQPIQHFSEIPHALQNATGSTGEPVAVVLRRDGQRLQTIITPQWGEGGKGKAAWLLGIAPHRDLTVLRYGPIDALGAALAETGKQTREMLTFIVQLIKGNASSKNLAGVIGIAQAAQAEASLGASRLLFFMASLSLTLCIMNLLPIPVLDGGHLLYYLIELVSGRPVNEQVLIAGQYVGLALLAALISLAFYNDLVRTIF